MNGIGVALRKLPLLGHSDECFQYSARPLINSRDSGPLIWNWGHSIPDHLYKYAIICRPYVVEPRLRLRRRMPNYKSIICSRTSATAPMAHALVRRGSQYDFSLSWCADFESRDSFIYALCPAVDPIGELETVFTTKATARHQYF
jgi:hypothetical protein